MNDHRNKFLLEIVRNSMFEYETKEKELLDLNSVTELGLLLMSAAGLSAIPDTPWEKEVKKWKPEEAVVKCIIESLVLLANSEALL